MAEGYYHGKELCPFFSLGGGQFENGISIRGNGPFLQMSQEHWFLSAQEALIQVSFISIGGITSDRNTVFQIG